MLFNSLTNNIILASQRSGALIPEGYEHFNIDRTTWFGNPFTNEASRNISIKAHREWFNSLDSKHRIKKELRKIRRRVKSGEKIALLCWCDPKPCHGQVYLDYIRKRL